MRELPTPTLPLQKLMNNFGSTQSPLRWWHWRSIWRLAAKG